MPITSISSWEPTMQEFNANWMQANSELGPSSLGNPIVLAGAYTQSQFQSDSTVVVGAIADVHSFLDAARTAAMARDNAKLALITRAKQFRNSVLSQITDNTYTVNLPSSPKEGGDLSKFTEPLEAMQRLWTRINGNASALGLSGPLLLQGGYTLASFTADIVALRGLYSSAMSAEETAAFARTRRDNQMDAIYERMKQYRMAAPARLPVNSPALANLPRLSPPPGSTPPGLQVLGQWNPTLMKATFSWEQSTFKDIDKIQVRGCPSGSYKNDDEEIVADLLPTATTFETDWGLTAAGSLATFKFYVMATTGNENGGKAVKIVRPTT